MDNSSIITFLTISKTKNITKASRVSHPNNNYRTLRSWIQLIFKIFFMSNLNLFLVILGDSWYNYIIAKEDDYYVS